MCVHVWCQKSCWVFVVVVVILSHLEEGTSTEEMPQLNWPVGKSAGLSS